MRSYVITVALGDARPITRTIAVPTDASFLELSRIVTAAMGWGGDHPHFFQVPDRGQEILQDSRTAAFPDMFEGRVPISRYEGVPLVFVFRHPEFDRKHRLSWDGIRDVPEAPMLLEWERPCPGESEQDEGGFDPSEAERRMRSWRSPGATLSEGDLAAVADAFVSVLRLPHYYDTMSGEAVVLGRDGRGLRTIGEDEARRSRYIPIRGKGDIPVYFLANCFADSEGIDAYVSSMDRYERFLGALSPGLRDRWDRHLEAAGRELAVRWAEWNLLKTEDGSEPGGMRLPRESMLLFRTFLCPGCGAAAHAVPDAGTMSAVIGRMQGVSIGVLRCPGCGRRTRLWGMEGLAGDDFFYEGIGLPSRYAERVISSRTMAKGKRGTTRASLLADGARAYVESGCEGASGMLEEALGLLGDDPTTRSRLPAFTKVAALSMMDGDPRCADGIVSVRGRLTGGYGALALVTAAAWCGDHALKAECLDMSRALDDDSDPWLAAATGVSRAHLCEDPDDAVRDVSRAVSLMVSSVGEGAGNRGAAMMLISALEAMEDVDPDGIHAAETEDMILGAVAGGCYDAVRIAAMLRKGMRLIDSGRIGEGVRMLEGIVEISEDHDELKDIVTRRLCARLLIHFHGSRRRELLEGAVDDLVSLMENGMDESLCQEAVALIMIEARDSGRASDLRSILSSRRMRVGGLPDSDGHRFSTDLVRCCAFPFV